MPMLSLAELHTHDPHPTRHGANLRFCCPLPACVDKKVNRAHQSLAVEQQTGAYKCHRCQSAGVVREHQTRAQDGQSGTAWRKQRAKKVFSFAASKAERDGNAEWKQRLRGVSPLAGTLGAAYLEGRGIPLALTAGVRFAPAWYGRPAVVFGLYTPPLAGREPVLMAAQGRFVDGRDDPKTQSAGPISSGVFATSGAWQAGCLLVCEAPLDALSLHVAGFSALALCGTAWRGEMALAFAWRSVGLAFDADAAGDKAAQMWNVAFGPLGVQVRRVRPVEAKDWNELLMRGGVAAVRACVTAQMGARQGMLASFPLPQPGACSRVRLPSETDAFTQTPCKAVSQHQLQILPKEQEPADLEDNVPKLLSGAEDALVLDPALCLFAPLLAALEAGELPLVRLRLPDGCVVENFAVYVRTQFKEFHAPKFRARALAELALCRDTWRQALADAEHAPRRE